MDERTELLTLECRLRLIQHASKQDREGVPNWLDLWVEAFWAGVKAQKNQRSKAKLLELLAAAGVDPAHPTPLTTTRSGLAPSRTARPRQRRRVHTRSAVRD